jgi:hypothetical protein
MERLWRLAVATSGNWWQMLADQLDYLIGVHPHRDAHALAIVEVRTGGLIAEATVAASRSGYQRALTFAQQHAPGRRVFAIEGTGSFGAGLTMWVPETRVGGITRQPCTRGSVLRGLHLVGRGQGR